MSETRRPFSLQDQHGRILEQLRLDLSEDTPKVYMKVCNSMSEPLAYKIKTTEPRRYIVRPNQGALGPLGEEVIEISLLKREKSELLKDAYHRSGALSGPKDQLDRFLVQAVAIEDELLDDLDTLAPNERSERLTEKWIEFAQDPTRKNVKKQKLDMHFTFGGEDEELDPASVADDIRERVSAGVASEPLDDDADAFEEMRRLRRQYDELVDFSVRLTAEREVLQKHLESTKANWMQEMRARVALENQLGVAGQSREASDEKRLSGDSEIASPPVSTGFSVVQIAVIAVVCFFVGRLLT